MVIVFYDYTVMITIGIARSITDKDLFNPLWIITLHFTGFMVYVPKSKDYSRGKRASGCLGGF